MTQENGCASYLYTFTCGHLSLEMLSHPDEFNTIQKPQPVTENFVQPPKLFSYQFGSDTDSMHSHDEACIRKFCHFIHSIFTGRVSDRWLFYDKVG